MNDYIIRNGELYHHGVKGMKWGVRKEYKPKGRRRKMKQDEPKKDKKRLQLTDKQKKAIKIGAAVAATALVAYGAYRLNKSGQLKKLIDNGRKFVNGMELDAKIDPETGLKLQSTNETMSQTLKKINPKFSMFDRHSWMNCGNCSIAFELRNRGFDVTALGNSKGMRLSQLGEFFKGFSSDSFHEVDLGDTSKIPNKSKFVRDAISKTITDAYSDDARGTIFFTGAQGSHFFNWVKSGDSVNYFDGQYPKANFDALFSSYKRHTGDSSAIQTTVVRLDNLKINADNIKNVVKNVGDSTGFHDSSFSPFTVKGPGFVADIPL